MYSTVFTFPPAWVYMLMIMPDRQENLLLASLSRKERARLDPFLQPVELDLSAVLIKANEPITHMLFPYDCVTSTLQVLSDGSTIETGLMVSKA